MSNSLKYKLKAALEGELPGGAAHCKMLPPGRQLKTYDHELTTVKMSSVLVLLFPEGNKQYTCLTKRTTTMKHHPGQISFPGGKVEKEDGSPLATALREAHEEVGLDASCVEILGKLSDLYVEVSRFSIQPFIGWCDRKPDFWINLLEVEELILVPISDFVMDEKISETDIATNIGLLKVKCYPYQNEIIWGATAMILTELIEIIRRQKVI